GEDSHVSLTEAGDAPAAAPRSAKPPRTALHAAARPPSREAKKGKAAARSANKHAERHLKRSVNHNQALSQEPKQDRTPARSQG
ncbi:MAG TPA: hypothetical protein VGR96_19505, partial [Acidobacteriaceae bacterium]|nr:hypothetical protein [Acidobacteriaceae bacterium]